MELSCWLWVVECQISFRRSRNAIVVVFGIVGAIAYRNIGGGEGASTGDKSEGKEKLHDESWGWVRWWFLQKKNCEREEEHVSTFSFGRTRDARGKHYWYNSWCTDLVVDCLFGGCQCFPRLSNIDSIISVYVCFISILGSTLLNFRCLLSAWLERF